MKAPYRRDGIIASAGLGDQGVRSAAAGTRCQTGPRLLLWLAATSGGGSLLLFAYFLVVGAPITIALADSPVACLAWDGLLCLVFFLQHSVMIRRSVKNRLARWVRPPYYPAVYAIASGIVLFALLLLWQPTDQFLFRLQGPSWWVPVGLMVLAVAGFFWGCHSLHQFDPLGIHAVQVHLRGMSEPSIPFVVDGPYRYVRHPLYLCMLLLIWSTPHLSTDRLLFNVLWTTWIVVGSMLEERDLIGHFGEPYRQYQRAVPMLIPSLRLLRGHTPPTP